MALHVSFGGDGEHERLPVLAANGGSELWTLATKALAGDTVVFYIKYPVASFVAVGEVLDDDRIDGHRYGWPGQLMGTVGNIEILGNPVHLRSAAAAVPGWGYLRQPHRNTTVPVEHEEPFLRALGNPAAPNSDPSVKVVENLRREARVLSRSRNRGLRDQVVAASRGTCEGCGVDYSLMEPRRWKSVLQAHHLRPLHQSDTPILSSVADLAALCPTCHVLAHVPRAPRTVRQIKSLYNPRR